MATIKDWNDIRKVVDEALREDYEREVADLTERLDLLQREVEHGAKALSALSRDANHYEYGQILGLMVFASTMLRDAIERSKISTMPNPDDIPF